MSARGSASARALTEREAVGADPGAARSAPAARRRGASAGFRVATAIPLAVLGAGALGGFSAAGPWDDAYMFSRYAENVLAHHTIAWQPGGEPSWGLTSLLHLAVVLGIRLAAGPQPALTLTLASLAAGAIFLAALLHLVLRYSGAPEAAGWLMIGVATVIATCVQDVAPHLVSGMDTAFALAFVTVFLLLLARYEASPGWRPALLAASWGGFAFLARPDLLPYAAGIPAVMALLARAAPRRRQAVAMFAIVVGMTVIEVLLGWAYFKSPLPLPFYAKSLPLYGEAIVREHYRFLSVRELGHFLESYWIFLAVLAVGWLGSGRAWWRGASPLEKGVLVATVVFLGYYACCVLQIMGFHRRFYYPALPGMALLATRAASRLLARARVWPGGDTRPAAWTIGPRVAALVAVILLPQSILVVERLVREAEARRIGSFDLVRHYRENYGRWWFKLDEVSRLPDDLVIATTEVGLPAALNPRKMIIDLAALNEREFAHHGLTADRIFARYHPDLVYLPHPDYRELIADIAAAPAFASAYDVYDAARLPAGMGLALRRDSRHYTAMRHIVGDVR